MGSLRAAAQFRGGQPAGVQPEHLGFIQVEAGALQREPVQCIGRVTREL